VRPIIEYTAFLWSNTNSNKLESVQRRAARYVMPDFDKYSSVSEMLSTLQWDNLKNRQDNQSLSIFYKLINGLVDVHIPECMVNNSLVTRGHNRRFINISTAVDNYKFSFFPRIFPMWNALPSASEEVNALTLEQFSAMLH